MLHPSDVGRPQEGWVSVAGTDLKPNEPVIIAGGYNLPDGTPVKIGGKDEDEGEKKPAAAKGEEDKKGEEPKKADDVKAAAKEARR